MNLHISYSYGQATLNKEVVDLEKGLVRNELPLDHMDLLQLEAFIKELRQTGVLQDIRSTDLPFGSK